jgi:cell pole-organizing protein PopZ
MPPRTPVAPSPPPAPRPQPEVSQQDNDAMLAAHQAPPEPASRPADDILDLTEQMAAPPDLDPPSFQTIDGQSDVVFTDAPPVPEPARPVEEPRRPPAPEPVVPDRNLMSASTTAAVDSAFNTLAHTVLVQNARTLEDLVREMLRPLLKGWLDGNLPGMVERIVKAEIERVARGR